MNDVLIYKTDVQKLVCRLNGCVGSKRNFNNCEKRCPDFNAIDKLPIVQLQKQNKPISYLDCSNAMMMMWIENVVTDGEYNRIMDKLNKSNLYKEYISNDKS